MGIPSIISLAGPPASGKTTLCKMIISSGKNYQLFNAPPISNAKLDPEAFRNFLVHQNEAASNFIKSIRKLKALSEKDFLICDRGIEDILCFSEYALRHVFGVNEVRKYLPKTNFQSDYCFYLDVDAGTLIERKNVRDKKDFGRGLGEKVPYWTFYRSWFLRRDKVIRLSTHDENSFSTMGRIKQWTESI